MVAAELGISDQPIYAWRRQARRATRLDPQQAPRKPHQYSSAAIGRRGPCGCSRLGAGRPGCSRCGAWLRWCAGAG
ncbi:hypothetical protein [Candidatus Poriferisodalis sp.]|uniref:hypothetical protein n=1 Tax=Candidatus Poriferisodalis sp. TaxID=3101277 RepID=UPI003B023B41